MKTITRARNMHDLVERSMKLQQFVRSEQSRWLQALIDVYDRAELAEIQLMRKQLGRHNHDLARRRLSRVIRRAHGKVQLNT